ncbi:heme-binding protein HmuY [Leptospira wolffii]|uniref:HmuY family protein n=1 Tax=Leptospira wolffii TaxID=409998 RepID=UPI001083D4DF|nr:HmuY family protein [Leptospira wolffii]TGL49425.1 heme-binding protein HmuY [Leptospira wolffii]
MKRILNITALLLLPIFVQCGGPDSGGDDALALLAASTESVGGCEAFSGEVTTTGSGTKTTEVNASSSSCWTYVDLKAGGVKTTVDGTWDMRFKRFVIGTNSGTSGSGSAGSCDSGRNTAGLSSVVVTDCTIAIDSPQSQTGGGGFGGATESASPALFEWYIYGASGDPNDHSLTPKDKSYLIKGSDGTSYFALTMTGYYASVGGTSGYPKFQWRAVP